MTTRCESCTPGLPCVLHEHWAIDDDREDWDREDDFGEVRNAERVDHARRSREYKAPPAPRAPA